VKAAIGCRRFGASFPRSNYNATAIMLANSFWPDSPRSSNPYCETTLVGRIRQDLSASCRIILLEPPIVIN
jgi:hypothetical protein